MKYHRIKGSADFGNLSGRPMGYVGDPSDSGEHNIDEETEQGSTGVSEGDRKEAAKSGDKVEEKKGGGLLDTLKDGAGLFGSMGSLCDCAKKDKQAENAKKEELAKKYPYRDCGPSPTVECQQFNEYQQRKRDEEFAQWQQMKDAQVAQNMQPSDQARFAFVAALAKKLKAKHPEACSMTLYEIYKAYPEDFDATYKELQAQFPFLKNIDAATALAMNPGVSSMTLDQLITKTDAISGGMGGASGRAPASTGAAGGLGGLLAVGGLLFAAVLFMRSRDR